MHILSARSFFPSFLTKTHLLRFASSRGYYHFGSSMERLDSVHLTHDGERMPVDQLVSPDSFDVYNVCGDQVIPRVGDQYQVEIPQLMTESEYLLYAKNPFEEQCVPILPCEFQMHHCLVLGSFGGAWSNIEEASFLLGLYTFGKNLVQVKRFIGTKTMGDILSRYYEKFCKSADYRRWSDCRKMRSKRCGYGPRIFTGLRQEELLSRLSLHLSEECQNTLLKVSKKFREGRVSLEEYVSTLKATVGMNSLVEAVGIGKGKQDLTGIALETSKYNRVNPTHAHVPIGKTWSSLSPSEITKFLTRDFQLSKARLSDLFWEAIWPRLLARGWHSEQPTDNKVDSINSLVFLMPGVKKFSRKRLEKGNHYFDCVADVLKRVASDPFLLELDTEADESNGNRETSLAVKLERPCYLKARTPNHNSDLVKLTVVDTSLKNGKPFKVRELKASPLEVLDRTPNHNSDLVKLTIVDTSLKNGKAFKVTELKASTFEVSKKTDSRSRYEENDTILIDQINGSNLSKMVSAIGDLTNGKYLESSKDFKSSCDDKKRRKSETCGHRVKESNLSFLASLTKRRRKLLPCTESEIRSSFLSSSASLSSEKKNHCPSEKKLYELASSHKRVSSTVSLKGSSAESRDGVIFAYENSQSHTLIDLNLPQVQPEFGTVEASTVELSNVEDDQISEIPEDPTAPKSSADLTGISRRQGTRNRPPTAKALEALANGYLTNCRRRKHKESFSKKNSTARPQVNGSFGTGTVASQMAEVGIGV